MELTLSTAARNAACNAVVDLIDGDTDPGILEIQDSDDSALVTFTLNDPAFGNADSGVAALDSDPALSDSADATGTANKAKFMDGSSTSVITGLTVGTDSTYDIEIDNTSISAGQTVNLTSGTITMPAS